MSDDDFQAWQKKAFIIVALVSVVGGNAGSVLNSVKPGMRADAWTATQDAAAMENLEDTVIRRFIRNEAYIDGIRDSAAAALTNDSVCQARMTQIQDQLEFHRNNDH